MEVGSCGRIPVVAVARSCPVEEFTYVSIEEAELSMFRSLGLAHPKIASDGPKYSQTFT